jgi:hypothetical protein
MTLAKRDVLSVEATNEVRQEFPEIVATGDIGSHFQRHHRYPGTHPLAARRFFAFPAAARGREVGVGVGAAECGFLR